MPNLTKNSPPFDALASLDDPSREKDPARLMCYALGLSWEAAFDCVPENAERTLALRAIQQAAHWIADAIIAGPNPPRPTT